MVRLDLESDSIMIYTVDWSDSPESPYLKSDSIQVPSVNQTSFLERPGIGVTKNMFPLMKL